MNDHKALINRGFSRLRYYKDCGRFSFVNLVHMTEYLDEKHLTNRQESSS